MEAYSALIGIIFGFILSKVDNYFTNRRTTKTQAKLFRKILKLEIAKNHKLLRMYWYELNNKIEENHKSNILVLGLGIVKSPFPLFSTTVWKKGVLQSIEHLRGHELNRLWDYYESLEHITELYEKIVNIRKLSESSTKQKDPSVKSRLCKSSFDYFLDNADFIIEKFRDTIEFVLKNEEILNFNSDHVGD